MTDPTKVFIDLSKCSEKQRNHIFSLLPEIGLKQQYIIIGNYKYLHYDGVFGWWVDKELCIVDKNELTYPEFIKLFEGGEGEKNVNYYDSANRFIQSILDSDWLLDSEQQIKLTDLYINHRISEEF